jgi:SAM-dependent methyltransferase
MRGNLPWLVPSLMQFAHFWPHEPLSDYYTLPSNAVQGESLQGFPFPVPPPTLWANYGSTPEDYLKSGKDDVEKMREICVQSGAPLEAAGRILEFGCAGGRMIRWLGDLSDSCEVWGADIWASAIIWCKQYLSPPFHFVTTTVCPHLPFEDRYFGFIYAGSVFTNMADLVDTWFLELRRVLRPGGRLYFTIHDRSTLSIFEGKQSEEEDERWSSRVGGGKEQWHNVMKFFPSHAEVQRFKRKEVDMVTLGRSVAAHVLWDVDFLCKRQQPFFRVLSITEKAYGPQTGVLLERV